MSPDELARARQLLVQARAALAAALPVAVDELLAAKDDHAMRAILEAFRAADCHAHEALDLLKGGAE